MRGTEEELDTRLGVMRCTAFTPGRAASAWTLEASVRTALGEPFSITWYEDALKGPYIAFERVQERWVVASAHGVAVEPGTSMASLEGRHAPMHDYWSYSRFCGSEQSERIRSLKIRDGRVVERFASVIYD